MVGVSNLSLLVRNRTLASLGGRTGNIEQYTYKCVKHLKVEKVL